MNKTLIITRDVVPEWRQHHFAVMASDINLPVNISDWPASLLTDLGNGQPFVFKSSNLNLSCSYIQQFGNITLEVYND